MRVKATDISYFESAQSRSGRAVIRNMETLTGLQRLLRMAKGYECELEDGADFFNVMVQKYRLQLDIVRGTLENIPPKGPLVLITNDPYGILDGLVMGIILAQTRRDFRILAHRVFRKTEELNRVILPVNFDGPKDAVKQNLATRRTAVEYLGEGGAIGIFLGGTVSTAPRLFGQAMDPKWRTFTAKLIAKTDATVVPLYFDGANSRVFQVTSHVHYTLRMELLINEFRRARKNPVRVVVGQPLDRDELNAYSSDPRAMMDFLRESTYRLSPKPLSSID